MKNYTLHLIRHGITEANLKKLFVGAGMDVPVCDAGFAHIERMMAQYTYPNPATVFVSPMLRARQTADMIYPDKTKIIIDELKETACGQFEGRTYEDLIQDPDFLRWNKLDDPEPYCPIGGETLPNFVDRCVRSLNGMFEFMMRSGTTEAVAVCHGAVINTMLTLSGLPEQPYDTWTTDNAAGYTLTTNTAMWMRDKKAEVSGVLPFGYVRPLNIVNAAAE